MDELCHHAVEYYSGAKRDGVLTLARRRMTLENILLSERSRTPKVTSCLVPFKRTAWNRQIHGDQEQVRLVRARGREDGGVT